MILGPIQRIRNLLPRQPRADPLGSADLLASFESLGNNCEFGTIQQFCGAEPFSLLRFTYSSIGNLIDVLETDAEHFFTSEDLELFQWDNNDEYMFRSRRYQDFAYHTYRMTSEISADAIRDEEVEKVAYLKEGWRDDLRSGDKIYVRKGLEDVADIERLQEALQRFAPNSLLWVVAATKSHPAGSFEVLRDGLFRGYISKFKNFEKDEAADLESWITICRQAYARHCLTRKLVSEPSEISFEDNRTIAFGHRWTVTSACRELPLGDLGGMPLAGAGATRLKWCNDTVATTVVVSVDIPLGHVAPRTIVVFAAWVLIPDHFNGVRLDAWFADFPALHSHGANLSLRDVWQKVWVSAKVPRGSTRAKVAIRSAGMKGTSVYLSSWRLEEGTVPSARSGPRRFGATSVQQGHLRHAQPSARRHLAGLLRPGDLDRRLRDLDEGGGIWLTFRRTAEALLAGERFEEADAALTQALAAFPGDSRFMELFARSADMSGRKGVAIDRWRTALESAPHDPVFFTGFAASFRAHGLVESASDVIANAVLLFPERGATVAEAARIADACHRYDEGLALWEKALTCERVEADWLHGHALALARVGRVAEARDATLAAVASHPRHQNLLALKAHFASLDRRPSAIAAAT